MLEIDNEKDNELKEYLVSLREAVKEGEMLDSESRIHLQALLRDKDAKLRRLAAQILGYARELDALPAIMRAYREESVLYVRESYLKAISEMDYSDYVDFFKERMEEIDALPATEEEKVHLLKERKALYELIARKDGIKKHTFTKLYDEREVLLTTRRGLQHVTYEQLTMFPRKRVSNGVMVKTTDITPLFDIRTFEEMLFYMGDTEGNISSPGQLALELERLSVVSFIQKTHKETHPMGVYIRIENCSKLNRRGSMQKRLGMAITDMTEGFLVNTVTGYEAELRLFALPGGGFRVFLKLFTMPRNRFHYRKTALPTSIKPTLAANLVYLAKPYMKVGAQIIDPFCGTGTMLIERRMQVRAGDTYGVDLYGKAIEIARENSKEVGPNIHYIQRDYATFVHDYLFDEVITDMPVRTRNVERSEVKARYELLFSKTRSILKSTGMMFVFGNEHGFMMQQLRQNRDFTLVKDYVIDDRKEMHFYIIRYEER
ncbi:23S rRNA G2445 N2-methylase RlmL [Lachnospiraceae bacterium XBB1006]|nr:23S rRNA G2445 N2-methylase RlmL [Lachnospiraceae bacterium XBB1006]